MLRGHEITGVAQQMLRLFSFLPCHSSRDTFDIPLLTLTDLRFKGKIWTACSTDRVLSETELPHAVLCRGVNSGYKNGTR